jgi:hypothetical protein
MVRQSEFDPSDYDGFTAAHLEVMQRFRDVAVDNHLDDGNLDGTGVNPQVNHHIKGVVSAEQLLNHYELPVVMSVPGGLGDQPRNIQANDTDYQFSVSAWVSDYDQQYGLELAQIIIGNIVDNIEENRTLQKADGSDPIAKDAHLSTGSDAVSFDFALNVNQQQVHLKYGSADFTVETKRRKP